MDPDLAFKICLAATALSSFLFGITLGSYFTRKHFDKQIKKILDNE